MSQILAIDPGTNESGYCVLEFGLVTTCGVKQNADILGIIREAAKFRQCKMLVIEMVASYGMPVGREVFETCGWIGRFQEKWHTPDEVSLIYRKDVKLHLCGTTKAKDPNVRQALIDQFGGSKESAIGKKATPGPLYGVKSHAWAALAVAVTAAARIESQDMAGRQAA